MPWTLSVGLGKLDREQSGRRDFAMRLWRNILTDAVTIRQRIRENLQWKKTYKLIPIRDECELCGQKDQRAHFLICQKDEERWTKVWKDIITNLDRIPPEEENWLKSGSQEDITQARRGIMPKSAKASAVLGALPQI